MKDVDGWGHFHLRGGEDTLLEFSSTHEVQHQAFPRSGFGRVQQIKS